MTDVSFKIESALFNFRVAAVIVLESQVLLCRLKKEQFWFLPGGRVKLGETTREALSRELKEELGGEHQIGRLMCCMENFFDHKSAQFHEICFIYEVAMLGSKQDLNDIQSHLDAGEEFKFFPFSELQRLDLKPPGLERIISQNNDDCAHVVVGR